MQVVNYFNSDWLFPTSESKRLVNALNANACNVSFVEIESDRGHDSFYQIPRLYNILRGFLIEQNLSNEKRKS